MDEIMKWVGFLAEIATIITFGVLVKQKNASNANWARGSESQKRAIKKWEKENKDKKRYISHRAWSRSFCRDYAIL